MAWANPTALIRNKPPRPCGVHRGTTRRASYGRREIIHARRSRNRCKAESCDSLRPVGADQRDFEGRRVERLRAGSHSDALVKLRAPAAGRLPLTAMSEEHGKRELLSRHDCDERPSDGPVGNPRGVAGACRRGRRPDVGAASADRGRRHYPIARRASSRTSKGTVETPSSSLALPIMTMQKGQETPTAPVPASAISFMRA